VLNTTTTYYVAAAEPGCPEESPRVPVTVTVVDIPTAGDINITGDENPICSSSIVTLVPSSTINGSYSWYFDANATNEITNGLVQGPVTYSIAPNGTLSITGLDEAGGPYNFYVRITEASAGCENAAGDLAQATVDIIDSTNSITIDSTPVIDLSNLIDFFQGTPSYNLTGSVNGDANVGDTVSLFINGQIYTGVLDTNLDFDIVVDGTDVALDVDGLIEVFLEGALCTLTGDITVDLPELVVDDLLQIFCASSNPTLLDLQVTGNDIVFFDSLDATTALDLNTPLVDGSVYFAGILDIPISVLTRIGITVTLLEDQPITLTGQTSEACLEEEQYTYSTESGKQNYTWTVTGGTIVDGGGTTDASATVIWTELQNTSISVLYEDSTSCTPTEATELQVEVEDCGEVLGEEFCLEVYNEFTPNNDGYNDFFEIECIENYSNTLQIFNRNGNKVFEAMDYQNNWDGIANVNGVIGKGQHLPSGTYYYVVNIPELNRNLVGWLQLAR
jgi:gliding motility-associated-like protein